MSVFTPLLHPSDCRDVHRHQRQAKAQKDNGLKAELKNIGILD
jgi:hypothetical protein